MESEDYLHALETMGKILLLTPLLMALHKSDSYRLR